MHILHQQDYTQSDAEPRTSEAISANRKRFDDTWERPTRHLLSPPKKHLNFRVKRLVTRTHNKENSNPIRPCSNTHCSSPDIKQTGLSIFFKRPFTPPKRSLCELNQVILKNCCTIASVKKKVYFEPKFRALWLIHETGPRSSLRDSTNESPFSYIRRIHLAVFDNWNHRFKQFTRLQCKN